MDDRTGFKVYPGTLTKDYTGYMTNKKSKDMRSGQEGVTGREDNYRGSDRPEQNDSFITDTINPEDL